MTRSTISGTALDHVEPVAGVDVLGAAVGQSLPEVVVGEQAGDAGGEVGGIGADERVLALDEVEALGADGVVTTGVQAIIDWITLRFTPAPCSSGTTESRERSM